MSWEDIVKDKEYWRNENDWERMNRIHSAKNILKDIKKIMMDLQHGDAFYEHQKVKDDLDKAIEILEEY